MNPLEADVVADRLGLTPLGFEGGYYRETYRSELVVPAQELDARYRPGPRRVSTAIFYMLTPETRSLMHRLRTDEVYHFYLGDPVELLMIRASGEHEIVRLGPDLLADQRVQHLVPAGTWQGSQLVEGGRFALMGTTMAPGFELSDFELGRRSDLLSRFPELADRLRRLTPQVLETPRLELAMATPDLLHAELRSTEALLAGLSAHDAPGWSSLAGHDRGELRSRLARLESGREERGWWGGYLVRRDDRALIGVAGYRGAPTPEGELELRVAIAAPARGHGLGKEAARALIERAREDPRVRRLLAYVPAGEAAARRVLRELGFRPASGSARVGAERFERELG